jgi:hypothetical protein
VSEAVLAVTEVEMFELADAISRAVITTAPIGLTQETLAAISTQASVAAARVVSDWRTPAPTRETT